jgi:hypothetical protein
MASLLAAATMLWNATQDKATYTSMGFVLTNSTKDVPFSVAAATWIADPRGIFAWPTLEAASAYVPHTTVAGNGFQVTTARRAIGEVDTFAMWTLGSVFKGSMQCQVLAFSSREAQPGVPLKVAWASAVQDDCALPIMADSTLPYVESSEDGTVVVMITQSAATAGYSLRTYDGQSGTQLADVQLPHVSDDDATFGVSIAADGSYVVVTHGNADAPPYGLYVYDKQGNKRDVVLTVDAAPMTSRLTNGGEFLVTGSSTSAAILKFNGTAYHPYGVLSSIDGGSEPASVAIGQSAAGKTLVTVGWESSNFQSSVAIYDLESLSMLSNYSVNSGQFTNNIVVAMDGEFAIAALESTQQGVLLRAGAAEPLWTFDGGVGSYVAAAILTVPASQTAYDVYFGIAGCTTQSGEGGAAYAWHLQA